MRTVVWLFKLQISVVINSKLVYLTIHPLPPDLPDNTQKNRQNTSDDESITEGSDYLPTNCSVTNTGQVQCSQAEVKYLP